MAFLRQAVQGQTGSASTSTAVLPFSASSIARASFTSGGMHLLGDVICQCIQNNSNKADGTTAKSATATEGTLQRHTSAGIFNVDLERALRFSAVGFTLVRYARASMHPCIRDQTQLTHHCIQSPSMMPSSLTSDG